MESSGCASLHLHSLAYALRLKLQTKSLLTEHNVGDGQMTTVRKSGKAPTSVMVEQLSSDVVQHLCDPTGAI